MFFLENPEARIRVIANHLSQQLDALCYEHWISFRKTLTHYAARFDKHPGVMQSTLNSTPLHGPDQLKTYIEDNPFDFNRKRFYSLPNSSIDWLFSTYVFQDLTDHYQNGVKTHTTQIFSDDAYLNSKEGYVYYYLLLKPMKEIHQELMTASPDYALISRKVLQIKNAQSNVTSKNDGKSTTLKIDYFSGGNILTNFVGGIINSLLNSIKLLAGIVCFLPYCFTQSEWVCYGNPAFLLEFATQIMNATARVIGAVIFPLGLLYSKETTGSWNVIKGELSRTVDSLIVLTQKQANQSEMAAMLATDDEPLIPQPAP